jgi:DNA/RNA-binding domain of Phe-tRNA-synthetase-like protein
MEEAGVTISISTTFLNRYAMVELSVSPEIKKLFPETLYGIICCEVQNTSFNPELWVEINSIEENIKQKYSLDSIREQVNISTTREAYKAFGGDPNRYRPSADSLYRRIVKGNGLYQISTLVDVINMISLKTGYSIGGFDLEKVEGALKVGIGQKNEAYEGIGRGELNIEGIQVIRDEKGPIGTPTSDHVRTSVQIDTRLFYMHINAYSGLKNLEQSITFAEESLSKFVLAKNIETAII